MDGIFQNRDRLNQAFATGAPLRELIRRKVVAFKCPRVEREDLEHDVVVRVLRAAPLYDASRGGIEPFFGKICENTLRIQLRHAKARKRDFRRNGPSLDSLLEHGARLGHDFLGGEAARAHLGVSPRSDIELVDLRVDLDAVRTGLTPNERVLWDTMLMANSVSDAARQADIPRHRFQKDWERLCAKLRRSDLRNYF